MRDVLGDSKKFAIVSLYELLERSNIPILAGMDKIQVIACYRRQRELCRVWIHIGSKRGRTIALSRQLRPRGMESRFHRNAI
jgi:hypothetical protein